VEGDDPAAPGGRRVGVYIRRRDTASLVNGVAPEAGPGRGAGKLSRVSSDSPDVITADDVAGLNRTAVTRSAGITRIAGTALLVIGAVALATALWVSVRTQQHLDDRYSYSGDFEGDQSDGPSFVDRVDAFSQTFSVWSLAGLALGGGLVLRLLADYTVARSGGSITGYLPGDRVPGDDTLDAPQVIVTPPEPPATPEPPTPGPPE
jgi:hypothetical protein